MGELFLKIKKGDTPHQKSYQVKHKALLRKIIKIKADLTAQELTAQLAGLTLHSESACASAKAADHPAPPPCKSLTSHLPRAFIVTQITKQRFDEFIEQERVAGLQRAIIAARLKSLAGDEEIFQIEEIDPEEAALLPAFPSAVEATLLNIYGDVEYEHPSFIAGDDGESVDSNHPDHPRNDYGDADGSSTSRESSDHFPRVCGQCYQLRLRNEAESCGESWTSCIHYKSHDSSLTLGADDAHSASDEEWP